MKSDVSVIIPNFNGEKYIANCLESILDQSFYECGRMEIIVVDDCSSDDSVDIIKGYQEVKLEINPVNSGFDKSVNQGIKANRRSACTNCKQTTD